jgi:hypothetical protein
MSTPAHKSYDKDRRLPLKMPMRMAQRWRCTWRIAVAEAAWRLVDRTSKI